MTYVTASLIEESKIERRTNRDLVRPRAAPAALVDSKQRHRWVRHLTTAHLWREKCSTLGVPNPERRCPHCSFHGGQKPIASIFFRGASAPCQCKKFLEAPQMKSPISVPNRKHTASFRTLSLLLAIAPLWLMLAAAYTSAHAQTPNPHPQTGRSS